MVQYQDIPKSIVKICLPETINVNGLGGAARLDRIEESSAKNETGIQVSLISKWCKFGWLDTILEANIKISNFVHCTKLTFISVYQGFGKPVFYGPKRG